MCIRDRGIHARPAALLAQCCVNFKSQVRIYLDEKVADGDNVLQILALGAKKGDTLRVDIDGDDEEVAAKAIEELLHGAFEEKKPVDVLKIAFFGTKDYDRDVYKRQPHDIVCFFVIFLIKTKKKRKLLFP